MQGLSESDRSESVPLQGAEGSPTARKRAMRGYAATSRRYSRDSRSRRLAYSSQASHARLALHFEEELERLEGAVRGVSLTTSRLTCIPCTSG